MVVNCLIVYLYLTKNILVSAMLRPFSQSVGGIINAENVSRETILVRVCIRQLNVSRETFVVCVEMRIIMFHVKRAYCVLKYALLCFT